MKGAPTSISLFAAIALTVAAAPARADFGTFLKGALRASEHAVKGSLDAAVIAGKASVGATGEAVGAVAGGGGGSGKYYKQWQQSEQYEPSQYQASQQYPQQDQQYQPQRTANRSQPQRTTLADHQIRGLRNEVMQEQARVQGRVDTELAGGKITAEQARSLREELIAIQIREHDARRDSKFDDQEAESLRDAIDLVDSRLDRYLVENMRVGRVRN